LEEVINVQRRITGGGDAVSPVNADGGDIDSHAWRWEVDDRGQATTVVVQVTGPATSANPVHPEVAAALQSRGRSVVDELLLAANDRLLRWVTLGHEGGREVVIASPWCTSRVTACPLHSRGVVKGTFA
jgi:hypothetical protein